MIEKVRAPISVLSIYNHKKKVFKPIILKWDGRSYKIKNIGFHHRYKKGTTVKHYFSVSSKDTFFKLVFDTESLSWHLEEISDGLPD